MTTNVWLKHSWFDYKWRWNPLVYGNVTTLHIPAEMLWLLDIVLYNNADGNYQVQIRTKALVRHDGMITWEPPAIYKSMCQIDVTWFPFDEQDCELKFGSWSYDGFEVDLIHFDRSKEIVTSDHGSTVWILQTGIDTSEFYPSVEWDVMAVPAIRHSESYECCNTKFIDISFKLSLRRKCLFYTVNLIVPCIAIGLLTISTFYLPCESYEKIELSISILVSLTIYFLLMVEIIPATSLVIPLIGKYLLFTIALVTLSVIQSIISLNLHHRSPYTTVMPAWIRATFVEKLPVFLGIRKPRPPSSGIILNEEFGLKAHEMVRYTADTLPRNFEAPTPKRYENCVPDLVVTNTDTDYTIILNHSQKSDADVILDQACFNLDAIADFFRMSDTVDEICSDWKFVSLVLIACCVTFFSSFA